MRWSLSAKITASLGGLLLGLSALITVLTFVQMRRSAIEQMQSLADTMNYTFEILMSPEALPSLQRVVENDATNRGVHKVVIVDRGGLVRASSDRMEVGRQVEAPLLRAFLERAQWERETTSQTERWSSCSRCVAAASSGARSAILAAPPR